MTRMINLIITSNISRQSRVKFRNGETRNKERSRSLPHKVSEGLKVLEQGPLEFDNWVKATGPTAAALSSILGQVCMTHEREYWSCVVDTISNREMLSSAAKFVIDNGEDSLAEFY